MVELLTMHLGPEQVLVAVRVDLDDSPHGRRRSRRSAAGRRRSCATAHPEITQVFLDATRPDPDLARRTAVHVERLRATAAAAAAEALRS